MPPEIRAFLRENWLSLLLFVLMLGFMIVMAYLMTRSEQTGLEIALETLILTACSVGISIVATKIYAERSYNQTLRDHGVQIASGIMVLKRQIEGLYDWVGQ